MGGRPNPATQYLSPCYMPSLSLFAPWLLPMSYVLSFAPEMPMKQSYRYESRPFELVAPVETGKFIPLVMFGSYWYEKSVSQFA